MSKKLLNSITLRIFLLVLMAGFIGVFGIAVLSRDMVELSDSYQAMVDEGYRNKEYMDSIRTLMYMDQAIVLNHIRTDSAAEMDRYEHQEKAIADMVRDTLKRFDENLKGEEKRQLYHNVYSSSLGYLSAVDNVFLLSRMRDKNTADYYVSSVMNENIDMVNDSIDELKELIDNEIVDGNQFMAQTINYSRTNTIVFTTILVMVVLIVLYLCVSMTAKLEQYKRSLETELDRKNNEILEHNRKIIAMQNNTVIGMANLIENRDGDTGEHIKRTSAYVEFIAREAAKEGRYSYILNENYIELLVKAAPMHDVGKIVVPDKILQKPGRLTPEEFEIMKTHAAEGGRIVRDVLEGVEEKEYIQIAADVATYHHEKWNGKGYPKGLTEENIPLAARIMAIADVFDALASKRCYKEAFSFEDAMSIIEKDAGSHFDPILVRVFLNNRDQVEKICYNSVVTHTAE